MFTEQLLESWLEDYATWHDDVTFAKPWLPSSPSC
jgi:hypothetical protein